MEISSAKHVGPICADCHNSDFKHKQFVGFGKALQCKTSMSALNFKKFFLILPFLELSLPEM